MAEQPPGGHRHFALATVGKSAYLGWNNNKTHPRLVRQVKNLTIAGYHAETHALHKIPQDKRSKARIYVCRVRRDGSFTMSKPCLHCRQVLIKEGIDVNNIWYTDKNGEWVRLKN